MSHHFDTPTGKEDPRINICDFYIFEGSPGTTVMAMTVNPDAGLSGPVTFRPEGLYAFRFDTNGDAKEEVTFKFRFGDVRHPDNDEHSHTQSFQVFRATLDDAVRGAAGDLLIEGENGNVHTQGQIQAYAGLAPDLFAADPLLLRSLLNAFYKEQRYSPDVSKNRQNFFDRRNVSAIVLEVPNDLIGHGMTHSWATVSLYGHAPEVQVSRWGLPMVTHLFFSDPDKQEGKEEFNRASPSEDLDKFSGAIGEFVEKLTTYAGSAVSPGEYAKQVIQRLCPTTLPYRLGTPAAFERTSFNGRTLTDDAMDAMLSLASNNLLEDGVAPDRRRTRSQFPYFGEPYSSAEQVGVAPARDPARK
jgi:Domain of unknown function (DUF4331)